jgi:hypothetical protein
LLSKLATVLAAPAIIGVLGIPALASAATPVTATAVTHLTNRPDSGYAGNTWARDNMRRTASVTLTGRDTHLTDCGAGATTCYAYTGTISDTGTARALAGVTSPGAQAVPIHGTPTAAVKGNATVSFDASSDAPSASLVPAALSGAGNAEQSTTNWAEQFFPAGTHFSAVSLPTWRWTYVVAKDCQTWVDAYNVTQASSGDISGADNCPTRPHPVVIRLSGGRSHSVTPTREDYSWVQSGRSWDKLTITGPGPIDGHVGYVNATHAGRVTAYYTGLLPRHTYEVNIQPEFTKGGAYEGPSGRVTFITG